MRKKEGDDKNIKNKKGMTYWDIFIFGKKKKKYKKRKTEKKIRRTFLKKKETEKITRRNQSYSETNNLLD